MLSLHAVRNLILRHLMRSGTREDTLDWFVALAMSNETQVRLLATGFVRGLPIFALESGRRRERRALAAPMARLQQRTQAAVTTGTPNIPAFPARRHYGLWRALPGVRALIATVAGGINRRLDPSVGGSGPHVFAVRTGAARLATPKRPSHPAQRSWRLAVTPLLAGRMGRTYS